MFRVHHGTEPANFSSLDAAIAYLREQLTHSAMTDAQNAGAEDIQIAYSEDIKKSTVEGREVFVEGTLTVEAAGRARITD